MSKTQWKSLYYIIMLFVFLLIVCSYSWFANVYCLAEDDLWIIHNTKMSLLYYDHGSILPIFLLYFMNSKLPEITGIHPQVLLTGFNVYIYGILFFFLNYLIAGAVFLFKKKNFLFPVLILVCSILFSAVVLLFEERNGYYWYTKESCTYIRYTVAMICFFGYFSYISKLYILKKIKTYSIPVIFLFSVLSANASEYNSVVAVIFMLISSIYFCVKKKHCLNFLKLSTTALAGLVTGAILIATNPGFVVVKECKAEVSILSKSLNEFIFFFKDNVMFYAVSFFILSVIAIVIIKRLYNKELFKRILFFSTAFFVSCNAFYAVLYTLAYKLEFFHPVLKTIYVASCSYLILIFFGLIIRKVKNVKTYTFIASLPVVISLLFFKPVYLTIKHNVSQIRKMNAINRIYLEKTEKDFLEKYRSGEKSIVLDGNSLIPRLYRDQYIRLFIPDTHKNVILDDSYEIKWINETEE